MEPHQPADELIEAAALVPGSSRARPPLHQPRRERLRGQRARHRGSGGASSAQRIGHVRDPALALPLEQPAPQPPERLAVHPVVLPDPLSSVEAAGSLGCPLSIHRWYSTTEPPAESTGPERGGR